MTILTKDEILKLAREAGIEDAHFVTPHPGVVTQLERFAALCRADLEMECDALAKDVNSTHTPAAWQVWVGADTPLNAPMGWQFYNTYDSLRSAEATARAINAAQQAPFAKVIPLYATPPAAAVSEPLTEEEILEIEEMQCHAHGTNISSTTLSVVRFVRAIEAVHGIKGDL